MTNKDDPSDDAQRRRNSIRRNALVLGLVALGIYVWFIASSVLGAGVP